MNHDDLNFGHDLTAAARIALACLDLTSLNDADTEADIGQVARALTGLAPAGKQGHSSRMRENLHDDGTKTFQGQTGKFDADDILAILVRNPATAR